MKTISVKTDKRNQMIDMTREVAQIVAQSGITSGLCTVYVPHTTAAVTINEGADPDVTRDILCYMSGLVQENGNFRHAEGNSDAHIKTSMFGASETIIVDNSKLVLGTWQAIYFCEFDGPRTRSLHVKVWGD